MTLFIVGFITGFFFGLFINWLIGKMREINTSRIDRIPRTAYGKKVKPVEVNRG